MRPAGPDHYFGFETSDGSGGTTSPARFRNKIKGIHGFQVYDANLNLLWTKKYNDEKEKSFVHYGVLDAEGTDIALWKKSCESKSDEVADYSIEIYDVATGKLPFSVPFVNKASLLELRKGKFIGNQFVIIAVTNTLKKGEDFRYSKIQGLTKLVFDRNSGTEISRNDALWKDLKGNADIDDDGKVNGAAYIHVVDVAFNPDDSLIVIGEGNDPGKDARIRDLYVWALSAEMKVTFAHVVEKTRTAQDRIIGDRICRASGHLII